jgi:small conductance mechanosensitive channel
MIQEVADSVTEAASQVATEAAFDFQSSLTAAYEKVMGWVYTAVESLPNVVAALVVLIVFWGLARLVRRIVARVAARIGDYPQVNRLITTAAYLAVLGLGLVLALGVLNLSKTVTSLLAGAGIVGLALGFAFQDIAENFIAGIILSIRDQFEDGDIIKVDDYMGVVEKVELRATTLRVPRGQTVLIPNADVYKNAITNFTKSGRHRVDIEVGVSYGDDLEKARRVAIEAVESVESRDPSEDVELFFTEFGGSSINFVVRFWIAYTRQVHFHQARSEAIMAIKKAFDDNDLTIPFPIRTLDFGAGPSGGESLASTLRGTGLGKTD